MFAHLYAAHYVIGHSIHKTIQQHLCHKVFFFFSSMFSCNPIGDEGLWTKKFYA